MAQASWWAEASGPGWIAERGPIVSDEVTFEVVETEKPKWSRRWWFGGMRAGSTYGPTISASLERRRWAAQLGVGVLFDSQGFDQIEGDLYTRSSGSTNGVVFLQLSRGRR